MIAHHKSTAMTGIVLAACVASAAFVQAQPSTLTAILYRPCCLHGADVDRQ